jgi:hypothetical protein
MKDHGGGVHGEILVRTDFAVVPAFLPVPFHQKHVVRKMDTETKVVRGWFFLPFIRIHFFQCNFKIFPHSPNLLNTTNFSTNFSTDFSLLNPMKDIYFFATIRKAKQL